jgi:release factor glutamine methyltransferase
MVVSNPPYVDPADRASLAPEVRDHEPAIALFPGGNAYAVYRRLVPQAMRFLRPGGRLVLEIGQGMSDGVDTLCREAGLVVERIVPDLQSIPRALLASRPGPKKDWA